MFLGMGRYHQDLKIAAPYCIGFMFTLIPVIIIHIKDTLRYHYTNTLAVNGSF